jgi:serine/threonine-protein kinase
MLQRGAILSGKYRIEGVLGEGGMAVVYAVTHLRNTARLAVKVLHEGSGLKGHVRARFVREGKVANSVHHPGAVQMIDDGVAEDGSPYLVMEHLNGACVDKMGAGGVPLSAALNIAYQVLDVLRAAHANGIVHRDIKPANLFVLRDGRVKVLDFGISRLHDGAEPFDSVATGSVMGTPFFMAPEQARANTSEIDNRTDLFAVGATLFTLISGKYLYTGDDARQVMTQAATQPARSLACVAPGTPQAVIDLVARALAYDSAARWESAEAMQAAVREVHERLCGPIGFEALATLLLVQEFRRKSRAQLARPMRLQPWPSDALDPSPLGTTHPAVADAARSREAVRAANDPSSSHDAPSSRISAEPSQLAGWTGDVPAPLAQPGAATRTASRFGRSLGKARVVRTGVLAGAIGIMLFGFAHCQAPPGAVAAKSPVSPDSQAAALVHPVAADVTTTTTAEAVAAFPATPPTAPLASTRSPAKTRVPSKPVSLPSTKPLPSELTASVERLDIAPTLIRPLEHYGP